MIRFDVLTLFPSMFTGPFSESILRRASQNNLVSLNVHDIRAYTTDRHHTADDSPYGGGAGQILKVEPIVDAIDSIVGALPDGDATKRSIILLAAQGRRFTQDIASRLSRLQHVILICGHYEGVDDRVREYLAADELSIGDYVLTGGEIPAMVVVDAVGRLVPGVLGSPASLDEESISTGLLECPHFTRPTEFRGLPVPPVLLTGDHATINRWRRGRSVTRTFLERPDLLSRADLRSEDVNTIATLISPDQPGQSVGGLSAESMDG